MITRIDRSAEVEQRCQCDQIILDRERERQRERERESRNTLSFGSRRCRGPDHQPRADHQPKVSRYCISDVTLRACERATARALAGHSARDNCLYNESLSFPFSLAVLAI